MTEKNAVIAICSVCKKKNILKKFGRAVSTSNWVDWVVKHRSEGHAVDIYLEEPK